MREKNKGVLTIEACLSFTCFAMIMFTILFLMRIVYTYEVIQHSITQTAKELSTYSYLYKATGADEINKTIYENTKAGVENYDEKVGKITESYTSLMNFEGEVSQLSGSVENQNLGEIQKQFQETNESYEDLESKYPDSIQAIKDIVSDPKKSLKSIVDVLAEGANNNGKTFVGGKIVQYMSAKYISSPDGSIESANNKLTRLRVIGGVNGLDFSQSKFFPDGSEDIDIVVCYTIDPIMPIDVLSKINLVNRVKVRAWNGSDGSDSNTDN